MKAGNRSWIVAAVVTVLVVAIGAGSASALSPEITVKASKHKSGPFTHDLQHLNIPLDAKKTVYWQVKNKSDLDLGLSFDDAATGGNPDGFRISWFKGRKNVSSDVKGAGYDFPLKAHKRKLFAAVVRHNSTGVPGFCLGGQASGAIVFSDSSYFTVNDNDCG